MLIIFLLMLMTSVEWINGAFFRHDMKHTGLQGADTQVRFFFSFFLVYLSVVEADFSLPTLVHH